MKTNSLYNKSLACEEASIIDIRFLGQQQKDDTRYLELHLFLTSAVWSACRPGQFVMLRPLSCGEYQVPLAWGNDLLWGRAFSLCRVEKEKKGVRIVLFLQVIGRGTLQLKGLNPGDKLLVWGPLGNGFKVEAKTPTLLLAGGMGLAPFIYYSCSHPFPNNLLLELGHRIPLNCYPIENLPSDMEFHAHFEKNIDDLHQFLHLIESRLSEYADKNGLVLVCGPKPFLQAVHKMSLSAGVRTQLSLETQMACGNGACLGCTVKTSPGYKFAPCPGWPVQVCLHGPVFWAEEICFE